VDPLLRVENLRTSFHTRLGVARAVDDVAFDVAQGRTLGLIGESGCGKSVTALSIMGLIDPPGRIEANSSIQLAGRELVGLPEKQLRRIRGEEVAMVFQEPMTSLNPVHTIGTQISEMVRAHRDVSKKAAREHALEMLNLVGIPSASKRIDDYPYELSGGMRQRVMIAIALACDPKVLIADEPTTALDVTIQAQILALLADVRERLDMAVILITHDLGVVAQVAEDVAVMYAGRIVETGPIESVFENPQHPYTEALLRSIPLMGMTQEQPLAVVRGSVPSPYAWPEGCRFADRCDYVFDRCRLQEPPLLSVGEQSAACWLCESGLRQAADSVPGGDQRA
jgi:oligopeptide/dipeptide ABC transporter ATP-binding protein